jgi:arsenate reductase-like glutaredoxin family protein
VLATYCLSPHNTINAYSHTKTETDTTDLVEKGLEQNDLVSLMEKGEKESIDALVCALSDFAREFPCTETHIFKSSNAQP